MKAPTIALFGHFGSGNVGNDSTLEAALANLQERLPTAKFVCICNGPSWVEQRFRIPALPADRLRSRVESRWLSRARRYFGRSYTVLSELAFWIWRPIWFTRIDMFVVVGTGAVDDMAVSRPWHAPYDLYKWCRCAKTGGAEVVFLSVGVGPIVDRRSQYFMLKALRLADRRSYRETAAVDYLNGVGFDTSEDALYPDLVFSLRKPELQVLKARRMSTPTVGLGLISYFGWKHDAVEGAPVFEAYISKIKQFARWVLEEGFALRLIVGDWIDQRSVIELTGYIEATLPAEARSRLISEPIHDVDDLFTQLSQTDVVVASRFHNVLCAMMVERPVISIGYHDKNLLLMEGMGLGQYCHHIEKFTDEWLVDRFRRCWGAREEIRARISGQLDERRRLLDMQYDDLVERLASRTPA